jgi:hypothetical protein
MMKSLVVQTSILEVLNREFTRSMLTKKTANEQSQQKKKKDLSKQLAREVNLWSYSYLTTLLVQGSIL